MGWFSVIQLFTFAVTRSAAVRGVPGSAAGLVNTCVPLFLGNNLTCDGFVMECRGDVAFIVNNSISKPKLE